MSVNVHKNNETGLTPRQKMALPIIAASPTLTEAARRASVNARTLKRWLEDEEFRSELERLHEESAELARSEIQGLMLRSVKVISDSLKDPSPTIRLNAARAAMALAVKLGDNRKLSQELEVLEDALPIWAAQRTRP